jgi:hypothetical protein
VGKSHKTPEVKETTSVHQPPPLASDEELAANAGRSGDAA